MCTVNRNYLNFLPLLVSAGGAISNMYSVMIARYKFFPEVKTKGMAAAPRLVLFTSEHVSLTLYHWLLSSDHWSTFITTVSISILSVTSVLTEPLFHQESQCGSGLRDREPDPHEDGWEVRFILNPHADGLVKDQTSGWLATVYLLLFQGESHSCWFGSQSNRGQAKGERQQQWLRHRPL